MILSSFSQSPARFLARSGLTAIGAALLMWLSMAITYGLALATSRTDLALRWLPSGADANAAYATEIIAKGGDPKEAERLAADALARQPVLPAAARALGLAAEVAGDPAKAEAAFNYSETLSRRDLGTQLWLIEHAVGKGDIAGALTHYNRALRTSQAARAQLFPILAAASADPAIARPLATLLARHPPWGLEFINYLSGTATNAATLAPLITRAGLDAKSAAGRRVLGQSFDRLVTLGSPESALRAYRQIVGAQGGGLIRNGGFESTEGIAPFDWTLNDSAGVSGFRELDDERDGMVLRARIDPAERGVVASQLLVLAPGAYVLAATVGGGEATSRSIASMTVTCLQDSRKLVDLALPSGERARRVQHRFVVPSGCRASRVAVVGASDIDSGAASFWIDDVALNALGSGKK